MTLIPSRTVGIKNSGKCYVLQQNCAMALGFTVSRDSANNGKSHIQPLLLMDFIKENEAINRKKRIKTADR